jgi:tRNA(Arg) A34 adenosine deaminase TadA
VSTAYLADSGKLYFAHHTQSDAPTSAIVRLIQGVYARDPKNALSLVRNRIFSSSLATEMCHGMVKVAAKRLTDCVPQAEIDEAISRSEKIDVSESFNALSNAFPFEENLNRDLAVMIHEKKPSSEVEWMAVAKKLLRDGENLPVAALLISKEGELLSAAINSNSQNRTLHAEVNLIQSFYRKHRRKIPSESKIVTTLKPCKMCAAMIWTASEKIESIQVVYGQMDEGSHARETVLNPGTFERKRASQTEIQLSCVIERPLRLMKNS